MHSGSACVVATPRRLLGITADHVLDQFLRDKRDHPEVQVRFGNAPFDPEAALIDRDARLDIATFALEPRTLVLSGAFPVMPVSWPPEPLKKGRFVMLGGYWGQKRRILPAGVLLRFLHFFGGLYYEPPGSQCRVHLDSDSWIALRGSVPAPQPNLGGLSGGPVYYVTGAFEPELAGIIVQGQANLELVTIHAAACIAADGRLRRDLF